MRRTWIVGVVAVVAVQLWVVNDSVAQCTMDTQCKGDRICEDGRCRYPDRSRSRAAPVKKAPVGDGWFRGAWVLGASRLVLNAAGRGLYQSRSGGGVNVCVVRWRLLPRGDSLVLSSGGGRYCPYKGMTLRRDARARRLVDTQNKSRWTREGAVRKPAPNSTTAWYVNETYAGFNFHDFALGARRTSRCQAVCRRTPRCRVWTHRNGRCWLKYGVPKRTRLQGAISGFVRLHPTRSCTGGMTWFVGHCVPRATVKRRTKRTEWVYASPRCPPFYSYKRGGRCHVCPSSRKWIRGGRCVAKTGPKVRARYRYVYKGGCRPGYPHRVGNTCYRCPANSFWIGGGMCRSYQPRSTTTRPPRTTAPRKGSGFKRCPPNYPNRVGNTCYSKCRPGCYWAGGGVCRCRKR